RLHARGGHAPLPAPAGRKKTHAQPGADRRRPRTAARRRPGARSARNHQPAAGCHRQARRDHLRPRTGRRPRRSRPSFSRLTPGADDPRRSPSLRRDLSSQAPPDPRSRHRVTRNSRRRRIHHPPPAGTFRQPASREASGCSGAVGGRDQISSRSNSRTFSKGSSQLLAVSSQFSAPSALVILSEAKDLLLALLTASRVRPPFVLKVGIRTGTSGGCRRTILTV